MANKRVRQFFEFTELNISDPPVFSRHPECCDEHPFCRVTSNNKKQLTTFRVICGGAWGISLLFVVHAMLAKDPHVGFTESKKTTRALVKNTINRQSELSLKSEIPALQVTAIRQRLYPIPLRKVEQVVFHHEENLNESWVVLDSVVFIPKVNG